MKNNQFTKKDAECLLSEIHQGLWVPIIITSDYQPSLIEVRTLRKGGLLLNVADGFFNMNFCSTKDPIKTLIKVPPFLCLRIWLGGIHKLIKTEKERYIKKQVASNEQLFNEAKDQL